MGKLIDLLEWKRRKEKPTETESIIDKIKKIKHSQARLEELIAELRKRRPQAHSDDQDDNR